MAEADTRDTTPPIELGTPWKSASQKGKPTEPLPLSPEQTHATPVRQRDRLTSATVPRESAERSTPEYKRSVGGSQQGEVTERDRAPASIDERTESDEVPTVSRRRLSHHEDERPGTPPPPAPQQPPFPPRPSSTNGAATGTIAQRRNLSAVSAISCSMCSATGVNNLWRRDRAGKPICGKCCEQLRRRLNPRYAAPTRGELHSESVRHSTSTLPVRRRTPTPPSARHAPYPPRGPPSHAAYAGAHQQGPAYASGSHHPAGPSASGHNERRGEHESYHGHPANGQANGNGSYSDSLRLPRFDPNGRHTDASRPAHTRSNSHLNGQAQGQGQSTTLPPMSSLERIADHYRPPPTANGAPGGLGGFRSKEPVALPAAYSRAGGAAEGGKGHHAPQNGNGEEIRRMAPLGSGGERERERYHASGQVSWYAGAPRRQAPPTGGPSSSGGMVTEAEIQAKRALLVEGRRWIFSMLDETTAMLRQLDDASLHVGGAE
ncbi:hypothetical protein QFC22_005626 [Naganishia vaughanmartiniae]|uniref:Uncharacterized protein n=1 Tax=Naganishia vaughanmartiniae TaxID=1424756 RepID=A0ACC2WUA6_9TREE|nr:hypothetical protein QFC22_005626 [Naganishia vaughanmartiniae]